MYVRMYVSMYSTLLPSILSHNVLYNRFVYFLINIFKTIASNDIIEVILYEIIILHPMIGCAVEKVNP